MSADEARHELLASAVGRALARLDGLVRVSFPAVLGEAFLQRAREAANNLQEDAEFAFVVSAGGRDGTISPERAIGVRSRDDETAASALLLSRDGDFKELKSLEAFRLANPGGVPTGVAGTTGTELDLVAIAREAAQLVAQVAARRPEPGLAETAIRRVAEFLGEVYRAAGNDEISWADAWWAHFRMALENLPACLDAAPEAPGREELAAHVAAGLPVPDDLRSGGFAPTNGGDRYWRIVRERWTTPEDIRLAVRDIAESERALGNLDTGANHPLDALEWEALATSRALYRHPVLAAAFHGASGENWVRAWASTTETSFFAEPATRPATAALLRDAGAGPVPIPVLEGGRVPVFIVPSTPDRPVNHGRLDVGHFVLSISAGLPPGEPLPDVDLSASPSALSIEVVGSWRVGPRGEMSADVHLSLRVRPGRWRERPFKITVIPRSIEGKRALGGDIALEVYLPAPWRPSLLLLERRGRRGTPRLLLHTQTSYVVERDSVGPANDDEAPRFDLAATTREISVVRVGRGASDEEVRLDDDVLAMSPCRPEWPGVGSSGWVASTGGGPLACGGFEALIAGPEESDGKLSPLVAAATGTTVERDVGSEVVGILLRDPRAELERWLAEQCVSREPDERFRRSLGIAALSGRGGTPGAFPRFDPVAALYSDGLAASPSLPREVAESPEADAFWQAFAGLELGELCQGDGNILDWPSRLDLRLLDKARVERYLTAFRALLGRARPYGEDCLAAFPFCSLLCDPRRGKVTGVLLSPLHPLRLGWNWSVQVQADASLGRAGSGPERVLGLLRFVDGSAFPAMAPSPRSIEHLVSAPLDDGHQGLFATWSYLRLPSSDGEVDSLLGRDFPAGTASGLDHGGVAAAVRDFLRVHPFSTQLKIALESTESLHRSRDLDHAVVAAVSAAANGREGLLPGGARVFDGLLRKGKGRDPEAVLDQLEPAADALETDRDSPAATFEWKVAEDARVDIRFLESPLVETAVRGEGVAPSGAGPTFPIGRTFAWSRHDPDGRRSAYNPAIPAPSFAGLRDYGEGLYALETLGGEGSGITCELLQASHLVTGSARWTVAGNAHMDPVSLSRALGAIRSASLALWEWRPAFLPRSAGPRTPTVTTARPYIVVATTGEQFLLGVQEAAEACIGSARDGLAREVLDELGTRGIGLSSLLSMGHRQSTGAIGFFLAFRALRHWERTSADGEVRCLLPMDALAAVVEAIADEVVESGTRRRADLLALWARRDGPDNFSVGFHPIEVKMRTGGTGDGAVFPSTVSSEVQYALGQLANSREALDKLCRTLDEGGDDILLLNAISTLLASALALRASPSGPAEERDLLRAAASGRCRYSSTAGSLLWFKAGGRDADGRPSEFRPGGRDEPSIFMLDPVALRDTLLSEETQGLHREIASALHPEPSAPPGSTSGPGGAPSGAGPSGPRPDVGPVPSAGGGKPPVARPVSGEGDAAGPGDTSGERTDGGIRVVVGHRRRNLELEEVTYEPSDTRLSQLNFGIVGDLGTGKTQFVKSLVYQLSRAARGNRGVAPKVFIFDYKRDYVDTGFISNIGAKVLDPDRSPIPLNFFALPAAAGRRDRVRRASFFADVVDRVNRIGPVQRDRLYEAVQSAYQANHEPLMSEVLEIYEAAAGRGDSVTAALKLMVDLEIFESDRAKLTTFAELFDRSTVLNLQGLNAGDAVRDVVVTLFLDLLYNDYMKTRQKHDFVTDPAGVQRRFVDSFVLVDEAHHILRHGFKVLEKLLLEGREFGMGVILSTQFLSHFTLGGVNWAQPLSTWSIHKVPDVTPRELTRLGFTGDTTRLSEEVVAMPNLHSLYKCNHGAREGVVIADFPYFRLVEG